MDLGQTISRIIGSVLLVTYVGSIYVLYTCAPTRVVNDTMLHCKMQLCKHCKTHIAHF